MTSRESDSGATRQTGRTTLTEGSRTLIAAFSVMMLILVVSIQVAQAATVVVTPSNMQGWGIGQETASATGSLAFGAATPPLGVGSAQMSVLNSTGGELLGTIAYAGTPLSQISNLAYNTYRSSVDSGNNLAISLQFDIDYDLTDTTTTWQGRLVFEPYNTPGVGGTVVQNTWQSWSPLAGTWWSTGTPIVGNVALTKACPISSPCTWAQVLALYPNAGIRVGIGGLEFKAGSAGSWPGFNGNVDAFTIATTTGGSTTYDFEPCVSAAEYVAPAPAGNDANNNCTNSSAPCATIQHAIDAACPGGTVNVYPGTYSETAAVPSPPACSGDTVGLYIATNGITIQGVDGGGAPITDPTQAAATVNTNSNLCFGPDGFLVTGDNVTIAGIRVGKNTNPTDPTNNQNKTIEIWGDNFTLKNCDIADLQGSIYFNDANFDAVNNVSHLQTYHIDGNIFEDGVSLDITNGAGLSGPPSGRVVTGNMFLIEATTPGSENWPSVSFNGSGTGVPWFVYSVGGAVITGNTFSNSAPDGQLIRARGTYDNSQFDWASYWNTNTFNKAAVVGSAPPAVVETYSYPNSYGMFTDVRRIGAIIQAEVDHAQANDTVLVATGTYVEQLTINASMTVTGAGAGATIVRAPAVLAGDASGFKNIITIGGGAGNAEVSDLTISGPGPSGCGSINTGIFVREGAQANIHNNTIANISDSSLSGCQNGQGIFVGRQFFSTSGGATIANNSIVGYQKGGIVVDNVGSTATISGNVITGVGATPLIAQNGIQISRGAVATVSGNTISGNLCNHSSCGPDPVNNDQSVGVLLYQAGAGTLVSGNSIANNDIGVYNLADGSTIHGNALAGNRYEGVFLDQGSATVDMNEIQDGNIGVIAVSFSGSTENAAGTLTCNRITGAATAGISLIDQNATDAVVPTISAQSNAIAGNNGLGLDGSSVPAGPALDAQNNYWGCASGPGTDGCDTAIGNVQMTPFSAVPPACVFCNADSDCNDGLVCDGAETCNLTAHTCEAGNPTNCPSSDSCHSGTCNEPGATCTATAKPDGTSCSSGGATCQGGVCTGGTGSLIVASARLKKNTARNAKFSNGSVFVQAVVIDEDTGGTLPDDLTTGGPVTVDVQDGSGTFYSPQPVVSLTSCTKNSAGNRVSCKGDTGRKTTATFTKIRYFGHPYGEVWKMTLRRAGLAANSMATGTIHVTLHQGPVDRSDSPSDCSTAGNTRVCHHPSN